MPNAVARVIAPAGNGQRVGRLVLQHRDDVADRRGPEPDDRRVLGGVDDLVDLSGLELRGHRHARPIGRERPLIARNDPARSFNRVAHRQHVVRGVRIDDGVRGVIAVGERMIGFPLGDDEVAPHQAADRPPVVGGDRRVHAKPVRGVELPAHPEQREALPHQEAVAHLRRRARVDASGRVVEEAQHPLPAAIGHLVEDGAVAARDVFRLDEEEVRGELHFPGGVARRLVQVGDDAVGRQGWIDSEEDLPGELLIGTRGAEGLAADEIAARLHLDAHDLRGRRRRRDDEQRDNAPPVQQSYAHVSLLRKPPTPTAEPSFDNGGIHLRTFESSSAPRGR